MVGENPAGQVMVAGLLRVHVGPVPENPAGQV